MLVFASVVADVVGVVEVVEEDPGEEAGGVDEAGVDEAKPQSFKY